MIQDDGHDGDDDRQRDDLRVGLQTHSRCIRQVGTDAYTAAKPFVGRFPVPWLVQGSWCVIPAGVKFWASGDFTKDQGSQGFQQAHLHTVASFGRVMVATLGNL